MRRYWVPPESISAGESSLGGQVHLRGPVFHHIFDVCRQEKGSRFEILDGQGKAYLVEVMELSSHSAAARILRTRPLPPPPLPRLSLALSVPRFPVFDSVVEKCVELGIHSIQPFFSQHSFVRSKDKISNSRLERWRKIVITATQQSGRGDLMKVEAPIPWDEMIEMLNPSARLKCLVAYEGPTTKTIENLLIEGEDWPRAEEIWIVVGSEGGFSQGEVKTFGDRGVPAVTLGDQVLRVETACIALLAILKYEMGQFRLSKNN
ncbi:MAG: hypothetical protein C5B49_11355 [Bdellovibrio sp.]|nr:MAG: hypothetical protein C5B49_11355 [Bdellovibrio sp.]